jgi:hypothetical protein
MQQAYNGINPTGEVLIFYHTNYNIAKNNKIWQWLLIFSDSWPGKTVVRTSVPDPCIMLHRIKFINVIIGIPNSMNLSHSWEEHIASFYETQRFITMFTTTCQPPQLNPN